MFDKVYIDRQQYLDYRKQNTDDVGIQDIYTCFDKDDKEHFIDEDGFILSRIKKADYLHFIFNWESIDYSLSHKYTNKKYFYYYDSIFDKGIAEMIVNYYKTIWNCEIDIEYIDISSACYKITDEKGKTKIIFDEEKFVKIMKDTEKKIKKDKKRHWNLVVSNPPFNDSGNNYIDAKLINMFNENNMADEGLFIHPASFLFSTKVKSFFKEFTKLNRVKLYWGNVIFGIGLFYPICTSHWLKSKKTNTITVEDKAINKQEYNIDDISEFKMHGINHPYKLVEFITSYMKKNGGSIIDDPNNVDKDYKRLNLNLYPIKVPAIQGSKPVDSYADDFFILIHKDINDNINPSKGWKFGKDYTYSFTLWVFKTAKEREHFINYCKSKVVRFLLSLNKYNQGMLKGRPCRLIPWMDFTKDWDDKKLCKEFNIDSDLWNYIDKFIPDYYEDYKSGF